MLPAIDLMGNDPHAELSAHGKMRQNAAIRGIQGEHIAGQFANQHQAAGRRGRATS